MKKYFIISSIALIAWIAIITFQLDREKAERKRLASNQTSLLEDVDYYRTKDSLSASSVQKLNLTVDEFKKHYADQKEIIESLKLKLKRIQSVTTTGTETKTELQIQMKDSLVLRDSLVYRKCMELHTPHLDISGCIDNDVFTGRLIQRDTLTHVLHRVPKKFWFIKHGTKAIRMEVVSSNPNTQLTYSRYIELK